MNSIKENRNKRVIRILIVFCIIFLGMTILLVVNSYSDRNRDIVNLRKMKALIPFVEEYYKKYNSFEGFVFPKDFELPKCSGEPIIKISSDKKKIIILSKLCSDDKKYHCIDRNNEDGDVWEVGNEVLVEDNYKCEF